MATVVTLPYDMPNLDRSPLRFEVARTTFCWAVWSLVQCMIQQVAVWMAA